MKLNIYAIKDAQISAFSQPFYSHTHGSALRAFTDHVNDPQSAPNKHPEDYALFHLGAFNDETGELSPVTPTHIGNATDYRKD